VQSCSVPNAFTATYIRQESGHSWFDVIVAYSMEHSASIVSYRDSGHRLTASKSTYVMTFTNIKLDLTVLL